MCKNYNVIFAGDFLLIVFGIALLSLCGKVMIIITADRSFGIEEVSEPERASTSNKESRISSRTVVVPDSIEKNFAIVFLVGWTAARRGRHRPSPSVVPHVLEELDVSCIDAAVAAMLCLGFASPASLPASGGGRWLSNDPCRSRQLWTPSWLPTGDSFWKCLVLMTVPFIVPNIISSM